VNAEMDICAKCLMPHCALVTALLLHEDMAPEAISHMIEGSDGIFLIPEDIDYHRVNCLSDYITPEALEATHAKMVEVSEGITEAEKEHLDVELRISMVPSNEATPAALYEDRQKGNTRLYDLRALQPIMKALYRAQKETIKKVK